MYLCQLNNGRDIGYLGACWFVFMGASINWSNSLIVDVVFVFFRKPHRLSVANFQKSWQLGSKVPIQFLSEAVEGGIPIDGVGRGKLLLEITQGTDSRNEEWSS